MEQELPYNEVEDYTAALEAVKKMPRFYIGQEVSTEFGDGILTFFDMPTNGLYISPERTQCVVWYGTSKARPFVTHTFNLGEIRAI